jgi:hypothetical protein
MPEQTHDPIRDLEQFDSGGLGMTPLEPAQVRRLGDRRRNRRNAVLVAAAVVAVVAAASPALILSNRSGSETPGPAGTTTPSPSPSSAPPSAPPKVITYPGSGVEVHTAADTSALVGTSTAFKDFIAVQAQKDADTGCPTPAVDVMKYSDAGYASGGVGGCGGYQAIWVLQDGAWREALATQDEWRCGDLERFDVPESISGDCYGPPALFGPADDAGLRLGMSSEEVVAAGGSVTGPGNGCSFVFPAGVTPKKNSTLGYLSATPGKGVVALYAQDGQVTPDGIAVSSTQQEVEAAYPAGHLDPVNGAWLSPIDANTSYRFDFDHGTTVRISLVADDQDCYE